MHPYLRAALICFAVVVTAMFWIAVFWGCAAAQQTVDYKVELAELINGRCSKCTLEYRTSKVYLDAYGTTTLASCGGGHYDERGVFVPPSPCNTSSRGWRCSNGHAGIETWPSY